MPLMAWRFDPRGVFLEGLKKQHKKTKTTHLWSGISFLENSNTAEQ